jgi:hypothetical protein
MAKAQGKSAQNDSAQAAQSSKKGGGGVSFLDAQVLRDGDFRYAPRCHTEY